MVSLSVQGEDIICVFILYMLFFPDVLEYACTFRLIHVVGWMGCLVAVFGPVPARSCRGGRRVDGCVCGCSYVCAVRSHRERVVAILDGATFWAWRRLGDATLFARSAQEATRWP